MDATQQIAAAVTPAVMVSACGLIALGLDNQTARMAARIRELMREWRELVPPAPRRALVAQQIRVLERRHGLYSRALLLNYAALFAFLVPSLLWLLQAVWPVPPALPVLVFGTGVALLAGMAVLVIASVNLARQTIRAEAEGVVGEGEPPVRGEPAPVGGR